MKERVIDRHSIRATPGNLTWAATPCIAEGVSQGDAPSPLEYYPYYRYLNNILNQDQDIKSDSNLTAEGSSHVFIKRLNCFPECVQGKTHRKTGKTQCPPLFRISVCLPLPVHVRVFQVHSLKPKPQSRSFSFFHCFAITR